MEQIDARGYVEGKHFDLMSVDDLQKVYELITKEENFILNWEIDNEFISEIIISKNISAKVINGEFKLIASREKK